mgnify:CR=1 FL=1
MEQNKREIKFRCFATTFPNKPMAFRYFNLSRAEDINRFRDCIISNPSSRMNQFTGLLDKNGKEIYCGDIVKGYFDTNEVEDYIWLSLTDEEKKNGWKLFKINMDIVEFARQQLPEELEIVGNVMENPNLLSEKEK